MDGVRGDHERGAGGERHEGKREGRASAGEAGVRRDTAGDRDRVRAADLEKGHPAEYAGLGGELRVRVGVHELVSVAHGTDGRGRSRRGSHAGVVDEDV